MSLLSRPCIIVKELRITNELRACFTALDTALEGSAAASFTASVSSGTFLAVSAFTLPAQEQRQPR